MLELSPGELVSSKYRIVRPLGFGDAGTVYQVTQTGIEVDRAMKFLDPKLTEVPEAVFAREFAAELKKCGYGGTGERSYRGSSPTG